MNDYDEAVDRQTLRRAVYALLIVTTLVNISARILTVRSADRQTPFFSANDRSRWSTISALVDERTYAIDHVRQRPGWSTIDMVRHTGRDGELHYYSSKPPLLPTLLALQYELLRYGTGWTMTTHTFEVSRVMLLITNLVPFALYLLLMTAWVEQYGETDFGRIFWVACACWGTFLTAFAISLNNHLPAAIGVSVALICVWRIWNEESPPAWLFVTCGLASAFSAANELPALSFLAIIGVTLCWLSPKKALYFFLPAALLVAIAFFAANYAAHASWRPPYAHRQAGENWYDYPGSYWMTQRQGVDAGEPSRWKYLFHVLFGHHGFFSLTPIWCLSLVGAIHWLTRGEPRQRYVGGLAVGLLGVCVLFYVGFRPLGDRNYGGVASGFRWLFWLTPIWLLAMAPATDWVAEKRWRRTIGLALLALAVLSVQLPADNPWVHPWLYEWPGG